jgi:hypothetical protein
MLSPTCVNSTPIMTVTTVIINTIFFMSSTSGDIMSAYIPIIKLTQRRQDAKNLRIFNYGRTTGLRPGKFYLILLFPADNPPSLVGKGVGGLGLWGLRAIILISISLVLVKILVEII